jgi:hypothetical protein
MKANRISFAPIHEDVTKLRGRDLSKNKPNMITAGFPCTDISRANPNGLGLKGPKSGLFYQICRLVDELPTVKYVFLENSPSIRSRGLEDVKAEFEKRGFKIKWDIFNSADYGASHSRSRWFCLAYKGKASLAKFIIPNLANPFTRQFSNQLVVKRSKAHIKRCKTLGNSIVPYVAFLAWNKLCGCTDINEREPKKLNLRFSDGTDVYHKNLWATPTYSGWCQHRRLSDRASRCLLDQVMYSDIPVYESDIAINYRDRYYSVNAAFVEYLMGYPKNWTKV